MAKRAWYRINIDDLGLRLTLGALLVTGVVLMFYFSLYQVRYTDRPVMIKKITKEKLEKASPFAAQVIAGMYIRDFPKFIVNRNKFKFQAVVWFLFRPEQILVESLGKFSFQNAVIDSKSEPDIRMHNGHVFVRYEVTAQLKTNLDFRYFPFAGHTVPLVLINEHVPFDELIMTTYDDAFNVADNLSITNWYITNTSATAGYLNATLDVADKRKTIKFPAVQFECQAASQGVKNIVIVFIPLFFSLILVLLSMLIPYDVNSVNTVSLGITTATMTSLLGYRFVIQSLSPEVNYATIIDKVYTLCLLAASVPFILNVVLLFHMQHKQETRKETRVRRFVNLYINDTKTILFFLLSATVLLSLYYILWK